jgi:hypothetical protein
MGSTDKSDFIRVNFARRTLASLKAVESSSRSTRHTAELAICSAPAILRSLVSVFLQRHPLLRSAALVAEPSSVFIVLLQQLRSLPVSLRRCSMSENVFSV